MSVEIPRGGPALTEILQLGLIGEKMSRPGRGLKTCRRCGWPLLLINQDRINGFRDDQPLRLACLNGCRGSGAPRRLDERDPFSTPPACGLDPATPYRRVWRGRREVWACPAHPGASTCPDFRVVEGDIG